MALKGVTEVFENEFSRMLVQIDNENYSSCMKISTNLIIFSAMVGFDNGIFIGEVLEKIFSEAVLLVNNYEVKGIDKEKIKMTSTTCVSGLKKKMNSLEDQLVYSLLKELRTVVTKTQFEYWGTSESKERKRIFGLEE